MQGHKESRFVVYLNKEDAEDQELKSRVEVAATTLGCSKSHLIRRAVEFALDSMVDFRTRVI